MYMIIQLATCVSKKPEIIQTVTMQIQWKPTLPLTFIMISNLVPSHTTTSYNWRIFPG